MIIVTSRKMIGLFLVLIVSVSPRIEGTDHQTVIAVYNSSNEKASSCVQGAHYQYTIDDLPSTFSSNTLLKICSNLTIEKNLTMSSFNKMALVGYDDPVLRCPFGTEVGLVFTNMHNLELHSFTIDGCGLLTDVDTDPLHNIKASVTIINTTNVTLVNITIMNGPGSGLAMFYNNGSVRVENSTFRENGRDRHTGGNGAYIETGPAVSTDYLANGLTAEYEFVECRFVGNIAATGKDNFIKGFSRFDKGGGMCIHVLASEKLNVTVTNAMFVRNEAEHYGGGLFVSFIGKSRNNNAFVMNSVFIENNATYGGATYSGYLHTRLPVLQTPLNCSHLYKTVTFVNNSADFGGGSSIFSSKTLGNDTYAQVIFENCTWTKNIGQYGSAVTVLPNAWNLYAEGYLPNPRFINCVLKDNAVRRRNIHVSGDYSQFSKGSGAFYCFGHSILFEKVTSFYWNIGSAMYLGSCLGIFTENSETTFYGNVGYQGGAIYQLSSIVYVHDNATVTFFGNQATDKGGAIYEHTFFMHIYDYSRTCFIDYIDNIKEVAKRNISVTFVYNYAGHSGHSIYASSLRPCYNRFSFSAADLSIDIFDQVGNFTYFPPYRAMEIATAINHSNITDKSWLGQLNFTPGKETQIPFFDVDDLNQNVTTNYLVTIDSDQIDTSKYYSEISSNILVLYGTAYSNATVTLSDTTSRQIAFSFVVTMQPCPPGFIEDESHSCICALNTDSSYVGIGSCNLTLMRAYQQRGYWIGYDASVTEGEDALLSAYSCPQGFCSNENRRLLPEMASRRALDQMMCAESRTGILCGQCKENFSVHYHSLDFKCKSEKYCTWGWLFYILSVTVPVTVVFFVIIFFNIPFTSGKFHGFIFYCQVVEILQLAASGLIPFSQTAQVVNEYHSLVYLSFSLNMFVLDDLSFCLWRGADALAIVAFNFVTLVYALLLIVLVTLLMRECNLRRHCSRFSRYVPLISEQFTFQGGIIHGLSAFLILCYAQCARSTVLLLTSSTIYQKGMKQMKKVVYINGDIEWMSLEHLPYAIPAIMLSLVIVVIPPILLLIYPLHYKVLSILRMGESRCAQIVFSPVEKLKPFFDSFQSCFKDEYRFFAGLYFVYRFFIMFNSVITYVQDCFFILEIQLVVMLILHAICQPYRERLHNVIDTLLIGNLAIINAIAYCIFSSTAGSNAANFKISVIIWLQTTLIVLPLPLMLLYLVTYLPFMKKCLNSCKKSWMTTHTETVNSEPNDLPARLNYGTFNTSDDEPYDS